MANVVGWDDLEECPAEELVEMIVAYNNYVVDTTAAGEMPFNFVEFVNSDLYEIIYSDNFAG